MSELDDLLTQAREADQQTRIALRNPIAAHGELAIDAMADWLGDTRLAGFAIRVLERIGQGQGLRSTVISTLAGVDRAELPAHLVGDLDWTLGQLGYAQPTRSGGPRTSRVGHGRGPSSPGARGRGYWVMRTSPWERSFIWAEALDGRLRQGWGTEEGHNLAVIATAIRAGYPLTEAQQEGRRSLRMLTSWEQGMRVGDVIVSPNLPDYGLLSIFRLTGSYEWAPVAPRRFGERFGHILPVELLVGDIGRGGSLVSQGLRTMLGVPTRLYSTPRTAAMLNGC